MLSLLLVVSLGLLSTVLTKSIESPWKRLHHKLHLPEHDRSIVRFGSSAVSPSGSEEQQRRRLGSLIHQVERSRVISLPDIRPEAVIGELIEFELFDGLVVLGRVDHVYQRSDTSVGWTGDLRILSPSSSSAADRTRSLQTSDGYFGLSCVQRSCVAQLQIHSTNQEFAIAPADLSLDEEGHGLYTIMELKLENHRRSGVTSQHVVHSMHNHDADASLVRGHLRGRGETSTKTSSSPELLGSSDDHILDILVVYTPEAVSNYAGGSVAAMEAMILLGNEQTNTILYNSAMGLRYRVIAMVSAGADFVEPTDDNAFNTLLDWLTKPADGNLDFVQPLRQQLGADEVLLVNAADAYCGLAWVNLGFSPDYAYANYNAGCLNGRVWAHEIGHNYGCWHDRFSDTKVSADYPDYLGFGSCWEDTSKNDCTCYSSVMVYDCNTPVNHCTSCSSANYMANYQVKNAGSATGTTTASCGLYIDQNKDSPIQYFPTTQPGGMIFSVTPNTAIATSCATVNITGWYLSLTGSDYSSVTIAGKTAKIVKMTKHSVIVLTPVISPSLTSSLTGDVVVRTSSGRVTTLKKGFTFTTSRYVDVQTWKSKSLPSGIWSNNGTIPWSFGSPPSFQDQISLFKDGGLGSSENFFVRLLWRSPTTFQDSLGGCSSVASSLSFSYWAYSSYSFCYNQFYVSVSVANSRSWTTIWNGVTGSNSGATPWLFANLSLPAQTTGIAIFADTANNQYCRWWAPVYIANLTTSLTASCDWGRACTLYGYPTPQPTRAPTAKPSVRPSFAPTKTPTAAPTRPPTAAPSVAPTKLPTAAPSFLPTKPPTLVPTRLPTAPPSRLPTAAPSPSPSVTPTTSKPSVAPTTPKPSAAPTTTKPSAAPTTAKPSAAPTTAKPSASPTAAPTAVPTTSKPSQAPTTSKPSLNPSNTNAPSLLGANERVPSKVPSIRPVVPPTRSPTKSS